MEEIVELSEVKVVLSIESIEFYMLKSLFQSFPWDPRNPHHNEFPWNPAAFPGRRRRATMPFPNLPDFCYN